MGCARSVAPASGSGHRQAPGGGQGAQQRQRAGRVAPERLPPSAGWAVTFFIAGPGWTALLAVVCALVSSLARDVRTAQQVVWGVVLTTSLGGATLLAAAVTQPLWVQALVAATGWLCVVVAIAAGQEVISRDLGR